MNLFTPYITEKFQYLELHRNFVPIYSKYKHLMSRPINEVTCVWELICHQFGNFLPLSLYN